VNKSYNACTSILSIFFNLFNVSPNKLEELSGRMRLFAASRISWSGGEGMQGSPDDRPP
jgi:hypothetical protein